MKLDSLIKILPLGSLFIITCSSIKLVLYYNIFNISITDYVGIDEILVSFIDDILYYAAIFGMGLTLNFYLESKKSKNIENVNNSTESKPKSTYKKVFAILGKIMEIITFLFVMLLINIILNNSLSEYKKISLIFALVLTVFIYYQIKLSGTKNEPNYYFTIATWAIILILFDGLRSGYRIKDNESLYTVNVLFNDSKKVNTDSTYHFVGKTKEFIFFYDSDLKKTDIYPNSNLAKIQISSKEE